jgi:hypothetical protein
MCFTNHCVCLSRSSLSICKDTNIVAIKDRADKGLGIYKHLICTAENNVNIFIFEIYRIRQK